MHWAHVSLVLGILLCLIGGFLMFEAHILGENARSWAPVIGIVGIGLIGTSGVGFASMRRKKI